MSYLMIIDGAAGNDGKRSPKSFMVDCRYLLLELKQSWAVSISLEQIGDISGLTCPMQNKEKIEMLAKWWE